MNQQLTKALFAVDTDKKAVFGDMHKTPGMWLWYGGYVGYL